MSRYVPDKTKLLCSKGIKMSRLKVKTHEHDCIYGELKGTYKDKMESNFICPQQSVAGVAMGVAMMLPLAGTLTLPCALFTLAGGLIGGASGAVKGFNAGSEVGEAIGNEIGNAAGSGIGGKIGEVVGSVAGGIGGAVGGFLSGLGSGAIKGGLFVPSYLGGLMLHIPPICDMLTSDDWMLYHPKVKIRGNFALLEISLLTCGLGGIIKIWMENLLPHLKKAIISNAIYYNPTDEAKMRQKADDEKDPKKKGKRQEELDAWLKSKQEVSDRLAMYEDIKKVEPTDPDLISRMNNKSSGFMSEIYSYQDENGKEVYVMVFKGTDNATQPKEDWVDTNAPQSIGLEAEQYYDTEQAAIAFEDAYPDQEIEFAGHSKAGGQATLAAAVTEHKASVFNPAGVHDATFENAQTNRETADQYVTSFHNHNGDILNTLQDHMYGLVPQASGTRVGLDTDIPTLFQDPIEGHLMPNMIDTLRREIESDPRTVKAVTI